MLSFSKMHGLGNDFVVVDGFAQALPDEKEWPALARRLTDRHFGIGADGLVFVQPHENVHGQMRIFNPDGSEPEMCGNAIRCVARFMYERLGLEGEILSINTLAGTKEVRLKLVEGKVRSVAVNMGKPILEAAAIPVAAANSPVVNWRFEAAGTEFVATCVSMGNPHCVIFVPRVDQVPLEDWGSAIETCPVFPRRVNVEFVQVVARNRLLARVWERGTGATLACGTGACAVAVAGVLTSNCATRVTVSLPGGDLQISWDGPGSEVWMEGPAIEVFQGQIDCDREMERG